MDVARAGSGRAHGAASSTIVSRGQVAELGLDQYDVIALGGAEYRQAVKSLRPDRLARIVPNAQRSDRLPARVASRTGEKQGR